MKTDSKYSKKIETYSSFPILSNPYYLSKDEYESGKQGIIYVDIETGEISFKEKVKLFSKYKKD